jgi:hypothetical protein
MLRDDTDAHYRGQKSMILVHLLQLAGSAQLSLIIAGALMPGAVDLRKHLRTLPEFIRRLFWVYYVFIGFCLLSFGTITLLLAEELASGSPLARSLCVFLAIFWLMRLLVAVFVFDVRPYLTSPLYRMGYQITNVLFSLLPLVFIWAAIA